MRVHRFHPEQEPLPTLISTLYFAETYEPCCVATADNLELVCRLFAVAKARLIRKICLRPIVISDHGQAEPEVAWLSTTRHCSIVANGIDHRLRVVSESDVYDVWINNEPYGGDRLAELMDGIEDEARGLADDSFELWFSRVTVMEQVCELCLR